jgi:hypothetical protein
MYEEGTISYWLLSSRGKQWQSVTSSLTVGRRKLKLPKIDIKKFGEKIKDFLSFWSLFKRIQDDKEMEKLDLTNYNIKEGLFTQTGRVRG